PPPPGPARPARGAGRPPGGRAAGAGRARGAVLPGPGPAPGGWPRSPAPSATRAAEPDPGVEQAVADVDDQVGGDEQQARDEDVAPDHRQVAPGDGRQN